MNRIRELLQEEQNFEIINYPTPPQYSMSKKGLKKVIEKEVSMRTVKQVVFLALANFGQLRPTSANFRMKAMIIVVSSQFDRRLFRSRVHSTETKGQFDRSKGFDRRVNDKN